MLPVLHRPRLREWRPPPFSPADVAGLQGWFSSDGARWQDTGRVMPANSDGDPVAVWDDASGNNRHLVQATDTKRATYQTNVRAARPSIRFDATDDFLQAVFTLSQPVTGFVVCRFPTASRFILDGAGAANKGSLFSSAPSTLRLNAATSLITGAVFTATPTAGAWVVITYVLNGTTSELYRNGTLATSGPAGATNPGGLTLGNGGGGTGGALGSDIGEVLLYTGVLSTTDRQRVEAYLLGRWMAPKEPIEVPGNTAWYRGDGPYYQEATPATPAAADGDPVGLWNTRATGGLNLSQASLSAPDRRPRLKLAQANGKPALRFDGLDDWLVGTNILGLISAATGVVYCVFRPAGFNQLNPANEGASAYLADALWMDADGYAGVTMTGATPRFLHAYNNDAAISPATADYARSELSAGGWYLHRWRHAGGTLYGRRSGTPETSAASGNTFGSDMLQVGVNATLAFPANADIAELIFFNVEPSAADTAALELYLSQRYGLSF